MFPNLTRNGIIGEGRLVTISVAQPAASEHWSHTISSTYAFELLHIHAKLVTSATVATRSFRVEMLSGAIIIGALRDSLGAHTQAENLTQFWDWSRTLRVPTTQAGTGATYAGREIYGPVIIPPSGIIRATQHTVALDGTDQWSEVYLHGIAYPC